MDEHGGHLCVVSLRSQAPSVARFKLNHYPESANHASFAQSTRHEFGGAGHLTESLDATIRS
jgi:hypothetical protein